MEVGGLPHVVQGVFDSKGQSYWQPTLQHRQIFSQTAQTVVEMMETVVTQGRGRWRKSGYRIAGKTGTAEKANLYGGGYYRVPKSPVSLALCR